jgi:hypothetical protein
LIALLVSAFLLTGASAAPAVADERPAIVDLAADVQEAGVVVSWSVRGGLTDDALERIRSGLPVTLRHRVELTGRRSAPFWRARVHGRAVVESTVRFDALTRQYDLERRTRIENGPGEPRLILDARRTESEEEMRAWLLAVGPLPAFVLPHEPPTRRLKLRVESTLGRRYLWYMLPWPITASAELLLGDA